MGSLMVLAGLLLVGMEKFERLEKENQITYSIPIKGKQKEKEKQSAISTVSARSQPITDGDAIRID